MTRTERVVHEDERRLGCEAELSRICALQFHPLRWDSKSREISTGTFDQRLRIIHADEPSKMILPRNNERTPFTTTDVYKSKFLGIDWGTLYGPPKIVDATRLIPISVYEVRTFSVDKPLDSAGVHADSDVKFISRAEPI